MPTQQSPLVIIDSGLGGLTVARRIQEQLPAEDVIYFGDTARMPYGSKSADAITKAVSEVVSWASLWKPKQVVIACNTATAAALPRVKAMFPKLSISGVIDPGARAAVEAAGPKTQPMIAVIATEATVRSKAYDHAIFRRRHMTTLYVQPTPLLASIIEDGRNEDDPLVRVALTQYLRPLVDRKPDVLVLGCTHYPVYRNIIQRMVGDRCVVIDSAEQSAHDVARRLLVGGLSRDDSNVGVLKCFVTDNPIKFRALAPQFLGRAIPSPTLVTLEGLTDRPVMAVAA